MFSNALELVLKFEGGFSDDPDDPGGRTNYGITQNVYDYTGKKDVKDITMPEVRKIYLTGYWDEAKCPAICDISEALATIHFDNAVNCGVITANKMLQDVLHVKVDGIIGPITLSRIHDGSDLQRAYLLRRQTFYDTLIQQKPKLAKFKKDWYFRLDKLASTLDVPFNTSE